MANARTLLDGLRKNIQAELEENENYKATAHHSASQLAHCESRLAVLRWVMSLIDGAEKAAGGDNG